MQVTKMKETLAEGKIMKEKNGRSFSFDLNKIEWQIILNKEMS